MRKCVVYKQTRFVSYFCDSMQVISNGYRINEISLTLSINQTIDFLMVCPVSPNAVHISLTICGNDPILSLTNGTSRYINIRRKVINNCFYTVKDRLHRKKRLTVIQLLYKTFDFYSAFSTLT